MVILTLNQVITAYRNGYLYTTKIEHWIYVDYGFFAKYTLIIYNLISSDKIVRRKHPKSACVSSKIWSLIKKYDN